MFLFLKFSTEVLYILNMKQSKIFWKHEQQKQGGGVLHFST
jgi:hypothetical protein